MMVVYIQQIFLYVSIYTLDKYVHTYVHTREKKRKDYAFRRQFIAKSSMIPGCPGSTYKTFVHLLA